MTNTEVYEAYYHVINHEMKLTRGRYTAPQSSAREILGITEQLRCIVESATVLRACATRYGLTKDEIAYESVSAHTNLVQAIVDRVLAHHYGSYFDKTEDGYTYREIMETIRRHDLPENLIGDIPDNGNRDDKKLTYDEHLYWREFAGESPSRESMFERQVERLQKEMEERSGFCGQLLYAADKVSAVLMVLSYDKKGLPPMIDSCRPGLSDRELSQMKICREKIARKADTFYKASEMWAIDYFKSRKLYKYDTTGVVTAILIMYIITTNEKWYEWREEDYENGS